MSRNPYQTKNQPPTLKNSLLVFMDILGYSYMIEASKDKDAETIFRDLYHALSTGRAWLDDKDIPEELRSISKKDLYAIKAFTDNIVISWPIRDDAESELGQALFKVGEFQFQMALNGYFVRGALSIGEAYVDEIAVFGDALIEAHKGESILARDPRIILTTSATNTAKRHLTYYSDPKDAPHARHILCDADGQWFVNYLQCVLWIEDRPLYEELRQHKSIVEQKLSQFKENPVVWSKYAWVASYHNYFCDLNSEHFSKEHKIELSLFQRQPRLIVSS